MKKWNVLNGFTVHSSQFTVHKLIDLLLENRGVKTKKEKEKFLNPKLEDVTPESVGIDVKQLRKTVKRIETAIVSKEKIIVFGDYDVDGIAGTAILWETLYKLGADAMPYIPHRIDQGYGLSIKGIDDVILSLFKHDTRRGLIITVDNGIVAKDAVDYANQQGIDVIITDHHVLGDKLPKAHSIVHTTKLCGTGVAYLLSQQIPSVISSKARNPMESSRRFAPQDDSDSERLALVALATVADLVPLTGANRTLLKFGLEELRKTKRIGLLALFKEAGIEQSKVDTYQIGHIIAPRLNAMGRLEYAMESLRLLCTKDRLKAHVLADKLGRTNKERQVLTEETVFHARQLVTTKKELSNLLFIYHESYQPGVIGLVAGRIVEEFYLPTIVLSKGEVHSKASARSISGFNIIEFIRGASEFLVDAGGHPMAAGFTVETAKIPELQKKLEEMAEKLLDKNILTRSFRIDCELPLSIVSLELYTLLFRLSPFGMGNPEPTFVTRGVKLEDMRIIGKDGKHLKLKVGSTDLRHSGKRGTSGSRISKGTDSGQARMTEFSFDAIAFGFGSRAGEFNIGDIIDIVYTVDENIWNGNTSLQLKIKDIKAS